MSILRLRDGYTRIVNKKIIFFQLFCTHYTYHTANKNIVTHSFKNFAVKPTTHAWTRHRIDDLPYTYFDLRLFTIVTGNGNLLHKHNVVCLNCKL